MINRQKSGQIPIRIGSRLFLPLLDLLIGVILLVPTLAISAPFNSGSTGADGAFAPTVDTTLALPPNGTFHFTTVTVPAGVTVTFTPNVTNTPVMILASGDVVISGIINVNGKDGTSSEIGSVTAGVTTTGGAGGPGGFAGGAGGLSPLGNGGAALSPGLGLGPGGGFSSYSCTTIYVSSGSFAGTGTCGGATYGTSNLLPLVGGSGGGGGSASGANSTTCTNGCNGGGGGGGGGAILIASSGTITFNGRITANGGSGGDGSYPGGAGSGGGIRLIANTFSGSGALAATGGSNRLFHAGGGGRVRLEANTFSSFTATSNPGASYSAPGLVNFSPVPTLSITAVGGVASPASPSGSFSSPDITLPSSTTNPVTVNLSASNVPVGTIVKVNVTHRNNSAATYNSTALSGTQASSTATASVSLNTTMPNVLRAETTFAVQTASNDFPTFAEGEKVEQIRVASVYGRKSEVFLITESGREIPWR